MHKESAILFCIPVTRY